MAEHAPIRMWVSDPPDAVVRQSLERICRAPDVARVVVMPDVHLAGGVSNGVVVATHRYLYPAAVGGDIGCGFATVAFSGSAAPLGRRMAAQATLETLPDFVPIMRHRRRDGPPELAGELSPERLTTPELAAKAAGEGRLEFATLGRGNHFLEFQEDDEDRLWAMVHSGSRALGQHIMAHHSRRGRLAGAGLAWLDAEDAPGQAYLRDLAWARAYAAMSRLRMLEGAALALSQVMDLEPDWSTLLNTDHNHVQREEHEGQSLWVHRKGANAAADGKPNMIPGSMATHTYHVEGRGHPESLGSSSHGAGRRMSRGAARAKIKRHDLVRQLADVWFDPDITSRLVDEAPSAYKDLDEVMRAQHDLVRIRRRLTPVLCYKGV